MYPGEPHARGSASRLNRLRAGVLGANDGIVSVAALVVGVAGATTASGTILTAGAAGLVGGAISMGLGEYVSVNSQRDSQQAMITEERRELKQHPEDELDELVRLYVAKGLTPTTAQQVAEQLTAKDPVAAHVDAELNLVSEEDIANPSAAALTSAGSFAVGGALPFLTMLLLPSPTRVAAHLHRRSAGPGADREPERPARGQPGAETDYSGGGRRRNRLGGHLRTGRGPW
jgi:vacuolar iron transporter family protein